MALGEAGVPEVLSIRQERVADPIILLPEKLAWGAGIDARIRLYKAAKLENAKTIVLDFSPVRSVYPNGIVPIVALVNRFKAEGKRFVAIPPTQPTIRNRFLRNGWLHFISPEDWPAGVTKGENDFPLRRFTDDKSLNDAINEAIEVLLQQFIFAEGVPQAFEWSLSEIAGNVLEHARADCGWIQVVAYPTNGNLALVVCDTGRGVLRSMKKRHKVSNDIQAITLAVRKGISGTDDIARGNGLAGAIAIAKHSNGLFVLNSGRGSIKLLESGEMQTREGPNYFGTCVEMQFEGNTKVDLPKALWGHNPVSYFESKLESDLGDLDLALASRASSFGNRITGERLRRLLTNLLIQNPTQSVRIVMEGIDVLSTSFADEMFGKLLLEIGPKEFVQRIRFDRASDLCKAILNDAISRRMAQLEAIGNGTWPS